MEDFSEKNRRVFERMSKSYKTDFSSALETLYRTVQSRRLWISDKWTDTEAGKGKEIKVLEYACGPGTTSLALAPFVTQLIGLDIADGMVNDYNNNAREAGLADKMVGYKGDLLAETVPADLSGPEFFDFDVVIVSMALHHFEKPDLALKRFGERLKKGGTCFIIDMVPDHHSHGHSHYDLPSLSDEFKETGETIKTHGFERADMQKLYDGAGVGMNFDYQVVDETLAFKKEGHDFSKTIFVARAQRQ
ncbi:hypothetical protein EYZ11_001690 [Aspergillus tanneri]|uniref:Methyltransferase domain-containing protein n=1 Tax=Aspergillus tanneri TaxID=1220188 RepID=A0A4S3JSM2_9EURO|nr:uncharacterized protein ATNIH1004_002438 [Aspergillus tanneri]KAA8649764.1 hypothetical protein ATNIH1004_002438 [Aspergillus tanneri]THC98843.1 hypothetical protein EYZ11_001690 [Aspergillus tanneri]